MDLRESIVIVSIFGRGNYLAGHLARTGIPVTLIDASHHMGDWYPEDLEGPFGVFPTTANQKERLEIDERTLEQPEGFCIWLKSGPIEFKGGIAEHRLLQLGIHPLVIKLLKNESFSKEELKALKALKFEESWVAGFADYLCQSVDTKPTDYLTGFKNISEVKSSSKGTLVGRRLFSDFSVRIPSSGGQAKSLAWCESLGVRVIRDVEIKDFVFEDARNLISIEVRTDRPGILQAEQVIFCLTAEETEKISLKVKRFLFGDTNPQPEATWIRYRAEVKPLNALSANEFDPQNLPSHFVILEDEFLYWSHGNLQIAQRAFLNGEVIPNQFDIWVRIPQHLRFNTDYIEKIWREIAQVWETRMPAIRCELVELPLEAKSTFEKLGPSRYPIFSRALLPIRREERAKNLHFDSPEYWNSLSWEGMFQHQDQIFVKIQEWWREREEVRLKREAKIAAARKKSNDRQNPGADL